MGRIVENCKTYNHAVFMSHVKVPTMFELADALENAITCGVRRVVRPPKPSLPPQPSLPLFPQPSNAPPLVAPDITPPQIFSPILSPAVPKAPPAQQGSQFEISLRNTESKLHFRTSSIFGDQIIAALQAQTFDFVKLKSLPEERKQAVVVAACSVATTTINQLAALSNPPDLFVLNAVVGQNNFSIQACGNPP